MELKAQIAAITGAAKEETAAEAETEGVGPLVTDQDIANIVAQWTGIPVEKVTGCAARILMTEFALWYKLFGALLALAFISPGQIAGFVTTGVQR